MWREDTREAVYSGFALAQDFDSKPIVTTEKLWRLAANCFQETRRSLAEARVRRKKYWSAASRFRRKSLRKIACKDKDIGQRRAALNGTKHSQAEGRLQKTLASGEPLSVERAFASGRPRSNEKIRTSGGPLLKGQREAASKVKKHGSRS